MQIAAKLADYGKPAWIAVMVLGFILFWPIGLGILAYMLWSGRMGCWKHGAPGRWHNKRKNSWQSRAENAPAGNSAFEEYREATLRRLEDEEREFHDYLERLRRAKDKEEFDRFMDELKSRPARDEGEPSDPGADDDTPPPADRGARKGDDRPRA